MVQRKIGALHLVHVVGGYLPAAANRIEGEYAYCGQHADQHHGKKKLYHREGATLHSGFLQNVI